MTRKRKRSRRARFTVEPCRDPLSLWRVIDHQTGLARVFANRAEARDYKRTAQPITPNPPHHMPELSKVPASRIIDGAMEATGESARSLAGEILVDERTFRRWQEGPDAPGGRDMPGPARLLVALIAAKPTILATLRKLAAGVPL